ncbi:MAG: DUF2117 domain-containing protein [Methanotrichaceae archaeon]
MKAWKQADRNRIGVVIHGPEVIDSGAAMKLINYLKRFGIVTAVLGGTMGQLAIIDAGLEGVIAISPKRRPSESLRDLQTASDILVLVDQAKTKDTGIAFGSKVADNAELTKPLIQIDCGGKFIAVLAGGGESLAERISKDLGLDLLNIEVPKSRHGKESDVAYTHGGYFTKRRLTGVMPGELITVNGIVIARAMDNFVKIEAVNGKIVKVTGAKIKPHGIEKLPPLDLAKAIIRSGSIRRTKASPRRALECKGNLAVLISHNAEDAFEISKNACIAVTVGDDTTSIAREILSRLSIPIIGIIDGDLDGLSGNKAEDGIDGVDDSASNSIFRPAADINMNITDITTNTVVQKGSTIIKVMPGYDDIVGAKVKEQIFNGADRAQITASELLNRITEIAGNHIMQIERF